MKPAGRISAGCDFFCFCRLSVPYTPTPSVKGLHEGKCHFPRGNRLFCACLSRVIDQSGVPEMDWMVGSLLGSLCVERARFSRQPLTNGTRTNNQSTKRPNRVSNTCPDA